VCHTCEIPYVFDNLRAPRLFPDSSSPELAAASEVDVRLAKMTSAYWINFAKTGDPNGKGLPKWPQFEDIASGPVLQLGPKPVVGDSLGPEKVQAYQQQFDSVFGKR
jgi:para-nitrobenzyl esterase